MTLWRLLPYRPSTQFLRVRMSMGRLWPPSVFRDGGESGPFTTNKDEAHVTPLRIVR